MLQRTEYFEDYAIAPLAETMLASDPNLKAEIKAKLIADLAFAKNAAAGLQAAVQVAPCQGRNDIFQGDEGSSTWQHVVQVAV